MRLTPSRYAAALSALALLLSACSSGSDREGDGSSSSPATSADAGVALATDSAVPAAADATDGGPLVTGPVTGGMEKIFTRSSADLAGHGFSEKEFFLEGSATAYALTGAMGMDGKWSLSEASKAPFKTRLLVRRPLDPSKFNGTVIVEWLNVSGSADGDPGFMYNSELILREGYAYVGVSAQKVGVEGGGISLGGAAAMPLKQYDPARYGSLAHPGDAYSYDIYSQAGQALRAPQQVDLLEGLKPARLIAYGESQSAIRMVSYVNGVHPIVKRYDGFFIHSRGAGGAAFDDKGGGLAAGFGGPATRIRDDLNEKVFQFLTETDVTGMLAFLPARQADSDTLRTWEVAGTSHADQYLVDFNASMVTEGAVQCNGANNGPQPRVIRAALQSLHLWLRDGTKPPLGDVLRTDSAGKSLKDELGNSLGGVRSPDVDVPIRTLSGDPPADGSGSFWCFLFGSTKPFTPDQLLALYPTHDDYVAKIQQAAQRAQAAGFLLPPEQQAFVTEAQNAHVPN